MASGESAMKKIILIAALVLFSGLLLAQEQTQVEPQAQVQTQVQPQPQPQVKNLKKIGFPQAFIHAGMEYPAGNYWLVLAEKDGQPLFTVSNEKQELLFEELAIVKARPGGRTGSSFRVRKEFMSEREYFRVLVTTPGQWLMGYFLVKK
jgi:hypothetical protein